MMTLKLLKETATLRHDSEVSNNARPYGDVKCTQSRSIVFKNQYSE